MDAACGAPHSLLVIRKPLRAVENCSGCPCVTHRGSPEPLCIETLFSFTTYVGGESLRGAVCSEPARSEMALLVAPRRCCGALGAHAWLLGLITLCVGEAGARGLEERGPFPGVSCAPHAFQAAGDAVWLWSSSVSLVPPLGRASCVADAEEASSGGPRSPRLLPALPPLSFNSCRSGMEEGRSLVLDRPCLGSGSMSSFLLLGPALLWEPWLENPPPEGQSLSRPHRLCRWLCPRGPSSLTAGGARQWLPAGLARPSLPKTSWWLSPAMQILQNGFLVWVLMFSGVLCVVFFLNAVSLQAILGPFGPWGATGPSCKAGHLPWKYAKVLAGAGWGAAGASWKPPRSDSAWLSADKPGASSSAPARAFRRSRLRLL